MKFSILVVCSANICRSPLAGHILRTALSRGGLQESIDVTTRGQRSSSSAPCCTEAVLNAERLGVDCKDLAAHRSHSITPRAISRADLVLTADRETRSAVAQLVHRSHDRTFTLREAVVLGQLVAAERSRRVSSLTGSLRQFVAELDDHRGLTDLPKTSQVRVPGRPWKRLPVHEYDIPDAHQLKHGAHRLTVDLVVESSTALASALVNWSGSEIVGRHLLTD